MPVFYLNLLQSFYNFPWNKENLISNLFYIISSTNRNFSNIFICFKIIIYWLIKKVFTINHDIIIFYFYFWKIIIWIWSSIIFIFKKIIQKSLFTLWKLGSTKWFKYWFCTYVFGSDWYLFQLIVYLKPHFNFWSSFVLSWVDKVTTGS